MGKLDHMVGKRTDVFNYGRHLLVLDSLNDPLHHHGMFAHADDTDLAIVHLLGNR